jgi:hypothetical protein
MKVIKTIKDLKIFIDEFDNYRFYSSTSTVYFEYSYSHYADQEVEVEGEALAFLLKEEAEEEAERKNRQTPEEKAWEAEEKARLFKNKNGGLFEFRCFAERKWFVYQIQATSLDDAERIGWEKVAKETAHWKGGSVTRRSCYFYSCE